MDISIVTDSTADIPAELIENYHIQVIPNLIMIDGASLRDGLDISRQEFYDRLPWLDPPPTTATASTGTYTETYERLFRQGARYILSIHPSAKLSGILNAASGAAQSFGKRCMCWIAASSRSGWASRCWQLPRPSTRVPVWKTYCTCSKRCASGCA